MVRTSAKGTPLLKECAHQKTSNIRNEPHQQSEKGQCRGSDVVPTSTAAGLGALIQRNLHPPSAPSKTLIRFLDRIASSYGATRKPCGIGIRAHAGVSLRPFREVHSTLIRGFLPDGKPCASGRRSVTQANVNVRYGCAPCKGGVTRDLQSLRTIDMVVNDIPAR